MRVCDGNCDLCPYPDCIDEDGYWDLVTLEERAVLNGPSSPERRRVYQRVYKRMRRATDSAFLEADRQSKREYYHQKVKTDPVRLEAHRAASRRHYKRYQERYRAQRHERYQQNREAELRYAKEYYRRKKQQGGYCNVRFHQNQRP